MIALLFAVSLVASQAAMHGFRAAGLQPFFYQSNFEPAVMMACGRGLVTSPSAPPQLAEFLNLTRNEFDCALLPATLNQLPLTTPANANWYYMYGAAAAVWKVTGVSWTALDVLVSAMSAAGAVMLYGLFRLITNLPLAAALAMVLTLSPANLTHLLSLRDYSKAPFVLAAVLILGVLVLRPLRRASTLGLAAAYGVVVGVGYGFRGDLAVMVPFGAVVAFLFLPGAWRANAARNAVATTVLLAAFFITAWPVISGLHLGGCQYHFSLLGLTDPLTSELRLTPPIYRLGTHLTDTFADLKTGDYAARVLGSSVPQLCTAEYDVASGQIYFDMARTFPADFVVRAYASVLMILRVGLAIPVAMVPMAPFADSGLMTTAYRTMSAVSEPVSALGVVVTLVAVAGAWAWSIRLGLAMTLFVLFLAGYPAIRFDERHWFHLRFIPWWAAALVVTEVLQRGARAWDRPRLIRGTVAVGVVLLALAAALGALRVVQRDSVETLVTQYLDAPTEILPAQATDSSTLRVDWRPHDYANAPAHRASDLLAVTLDGSACTGSGPIDLTVTHEADVASHDLSTSFRVPRPQAGADPTKLFVPVFWQGLGDHVDLRFSGLRVAGAPVACVGRVARVTSGPDLPLWVEVVVPPDWQRHPLYESMRLPRLLTW